jgi:hypothetical protein
MNKIMNEPEPFGFIITRNISNDIHKNYWRECVKCIRKFYANEKIIIIDDNSSLKMDKKIEMNEYYNIEIVDSEYQGAGEILGYYYGWKYRPFHKYVVLHDSMFLQSKLPESQNTRFLWHFDTYLGQGINGTNDTNVTFINYCDQKEKLLNLYFDKNAWLGCFGVSSLVTLDFLDVLFSQYNFLNCIKEVKVRHHREAMERVFALIVFLEEPLLKIKSSFFGNILTDYPNAYAVKWEDYINGYRNYNIAVNKVWSSR